MKLTRRNFIASLAAAFTAFGPTHKTIARFTSRKSSRPNVVFILADDLGWGDLSCYGRPDYGTPNLDLLAAQVTKFTDAYSASAVCTPTRCAFMTGCYPARSKIGLTEPLPASNHLVGLEAHDEPTIASLLKVNG